MAVSVETEPDFSVGVPNGLFRVSRLTGAVYDVAPDGQSFFVVKRDSAPKELRIVFNWFEELERLTSN